MLKDKFFQKAIIFSCFVHAVIFLQNPYLFDNNLPKAISQIEVTYLPKINAPQEKILQENIRQELIKNKIENLQRKLPPPFLENFLNNNKENIAEKKIDLTCQKPQTTIKAVEVKKIVQPRLDSEEKIKSPTYLNYYQAIREKIRLQAYQNYSQPEEGEVYLSFVILRNGNLKEVKIKEEKSSPSQYLKEIALSSIQEASPYSIFPKELDYPELSFNVIISFQITD